MKRSIVLAALLLMMANASAQGAAEIGGAGTVSCGVYLQDRKTDNRTDIQYIQWIWGYISAYNFFSQHAQISRTRIDGGTILAYLEKYCRDNPLQFVVGGGDAMIDRQIP
jgi:hypothetical protein